MEREEFAAMMREEFKVTDENEASDWGFRCALALFAAIMATVIMGIAIGPNFFTVILPGIAALAYMIVSVARTSFGLRGVVIVISVMAITFGGIVIGSDLMSDLLL